jgi:hypothetical protein
MFMVFKHQEQPCPYFLHVECLRFTTYILAVIWRLTVSPLVLVYTVLGKR